jgi:integrase
MVAIGARWASGRSGGRASWRRRQAAVPRAGDLVFPGGREGTAISRTAMTDFLKRIRLDVTVHGFRSSFRDWASETTGFPHEVCEMALAHAIANKAEAAYRRGDLFEKRRKLMIAWTGYCATPKTAQIIPLRKQALG